MPHRPAGLGAQLSLGRRTGGGGKVRVCQAGRAVCAKAPGGEPREASQAQGGSEERGRPCGHAVPFDSCPPWGPPSPPCTQGQTTEKR